MRQRGPGPGSDNRLERLAASSFATKTIADFSRQVELSHAGPDHADYFFHDLAGDSARLADRVHLQWGFDRTQARPQGLLRPASERALLRRGASTFQDARVH